ncbi:MAG: enolase C-terminal domain-like protein [Planctomycetaceae bacterium]
MELTLTAAGLLSQAKALSRLEEYDISFAEQPISTHDPLNLADLRQCTNIPIMADESLFTSQDAWHLTQLRAADIFSVYPGKHGGIQATVEITNIAKAAGVVCSIGSNLELGIGTAAMLHVAAAIDTIDSTNFPGDFIGPLYHETDLLKTPLSLGPVVATIPEGPGLGVELDEDQLNFYRDHESDARALDQILDG